MSVQLLCFSPMPFSHAPGLPAGCLPEIDKSHAEEAIQICAEEIGGAVPGR